MNLTPFVKKDKIFIFYAAIEFFCCRMLHDYFSFFKREGVQTHKARLAASHTVNNSTSTADVRLHDIFYFICFAFNFFKHMRYETREIFYYIKNVE